LRLIQPIDAAPTRIILQPARVNLQRDRRILVPELPAHVRHGLADVDEERAVGVAHLMRAAAMQLRLVEDLVERLADVRFVERRACG